jgi:ribosomal protein S18 acetylase RimI-like enzyme
LNKKNLINIRPARIDDEKTIMDFTEQTGFFRPVEMDIAREVFVDAAIAKPGCTYQSYIAEIQESIEDGRRARDEGRIVHHPLSIMPCVAGWICFGATPCTLGTFDIYWIVVDMSLQRQGIGRCLLDFARDEIAKQHGRLMVIETSGSGLYEPTQNFYLKNGFFLAGRIPEFYAPGDDKLIYLKTV